MSPFPTGVYLLLRAMAWCAVTAALPIFGTFPLACLAKAPAVAFSSVPFEIGTCLEPPLEKAASLSASLLRPLMEF